MTLIHFIECLFDRKFVEIFKFPIEINMKRFIYEMDFLWNDFLLNRHLWIGPLLYFIFGIVGKFELSFSLSSFFSF